jgi:hypothetical protein
MIKFLNILIITIIISFFPLSCYDFFWHLKTGEYIFKDGIPKEDPFSYNSKGEWINHAWGYDLFIYLLFKTGKFNLLFLFKYFLVFLIAITIFFLCKEKDFTYLFSLSLIFFALSLSRHRLDLRPDAVGHLFFLFLLFSFQKRKYFLSIIILTIWVNFHASFIFGAFFSFLYFILKFLKERSRKYLLYGIFSLIFPLINPFFYKAYIAPVKLIFELKSLNLVNPEWLFAPFFPFFAFYLSIPATLYLIFTQEEKIKKLLFIPVFLLSFSSLRFIGFFSISIPFFIEKEKKSLKYLFSLIGLIGLILSFKYISKPGTGIDFEKIPFEEVNFLKKINFKGNLFCTPGYGGYLIYNFYPEKKVFWDGRNELYIDLLKEFEIALKSRNNWNSFLEKYKIDLALIKYQGLMKVKIGGEFKVLPSSFAYFPKEEWDLVFWDSSGMVFMRKNLMNLKVYKFNPEVLEYLIYLVRNKEINKNELIEELNEKLKQNPNCKRAKEILKKLW